MTVFDVGEPVALTCTFRDTNNANALYDPNGVIAKVRPPSTSSPTTYTYGTDTQLTRSSTGVYVLSVVALASGDTWVQFTAKDSGGNVQVIEESYFGVRKSNVS